MTLAAGSRLGPYEILSPLGAGGMGEVYKARDTRLERTVAVKVLPSHMSASPESRQRFEREAKTISQLSHPHICALHDVGSQDGVEYLVMELLEGETLSDRLAKGSLPLEQTLRYGQEIADALDKAHRQGIVHRDLKPGNVMLTKTGVKLLDFGLAKAIAPVSSQSSLTALPTQQNLTQEGTILGTLQYMAPEQLESRDADARTDIFALGAVLYEMAAGRKAFTGASQASLISAIMKEDPAPIFSVQPMTPPALDRVVRKCLAKDPEDRWQNAADLGSELRWVGEGSAAGVAAPLGPRSRGSERIAWGLASLCFLGMLAFAFLHLGLRSPVPARAARFQVPLPGAVGTVSGLALSPDGSQLVYVAPAPGAANALWLRPLDSVDARHIEGTDDAVMPFWSPDGRRVGFFAGGSLKIVDIGTGTTKTLYAGNGEPRGASWGREGTIVFSPNFQSTLLRVSAEGGPVAPASAFDGERKEQTHRWPSFLPDGRRFLYYSSKGSGEEPGDILLGSLEGGSSKRVMASSSQAVFVPPGYLVFDSGRNLVAQPFDPNRAALSGEPHPVSSSLSRISEAAGYRPFAVSATGILVFQPGTTGRASRLAWLDRSGKEISLVAEGPYYAPRLSRDGTRLAVTRWDPDTTVGDIWLFDLVRAAGSRFTFDPADDNLATWTPDGQRIIFGSSREGAVNLYQARADRAGSDEPLLRSVSFKEPDDVSPDGQSLVFESADPKSGGRIGLWILPLTGKQEPRPFTMGTFFEASGNFSPDGRWIAYSSTESGREEVYVAAFPGPGGKWQASIGGGRTPRWRADGRELLYFGSSGNLMSVEVTTEPTFQAQAPRPLFKVSLVSGPDRQFDVAPDGKRILVNAMSGSEEAAQITVVLNWAAALERK